MCEFRVIMFSQKSDESKLIADEIVDFKLNGRTLTLIDAFGMEKEIKHAIPIQLDSRRATLFVLKIDEELSMLIESRLKAERI